MAGSFLPAPGSLPPIVEHNARSSGTDAVGYLTESPGFSTFVRDDGAVYRRVLDDLARIGVPAGLLRNLDRAPNGRDEGEAWQLWIRRQDEYESM